MTTKLQLLALHILNSKYRIFFAIGLSVSIYLFFYGDKIIYCMNHQSIPDIAEAKLSSRNTKSLIQHEISSFVGFAETIEEQKSLLKTQQLYINDLETDLKMSEDKNLPLKEDVKRITSKYLDQTFYVDHLKSYNQQLYSENVTLRKHIAELEEALKRLNYKSDT